MRWLRGLRPFIAAVAVALTIGCYSPTVPLPPPDEPEVGKVDPQGMVKIRGGASKYALVSLFNERSGSGVIVTADGGGVYEAVIAAMAGDEVSIWQEVDGEKSPSIRITIK